VQTIPKWKSRLFELMNLGKNNINSVRIHLTNVEGAGASQLALSLLPAIESIKEFHVERLYIPDRGKLGTYNSSKPTTTIQVYRRWLPNILSRLLECTLFGRQFDGNSPLLVLGDLPLRCQGLQTVFVQNANLLAPEQIRIRVDEIKYLISRILFRLNMSRVHSFIVQTDYMREALECTYPSLKGRVYVIGQPVPTWLLHSGLLRQARFRNRREPLALIYPAAGYPHKNHSLLSNFDSQINLPVERLTLTLDVGANPAPQLPWVQCSGFLSTHEMLVAYSKVDALLFLSKKESFGFPLVEAMFIGLPIICPDLPYARTLCGDQAVYFDPDNTDSLCNALKELHTMLGDGWWPDWRERLKNIPSDWTTVACYMLKITCAE